MRIAFMYTEFLRLSTIKQCPQMLRSDHSELRNSQIKSIGGTRTALALAGDGALQDLSIKHFIVREREREREPSE